MHSPTAAELNSCNTDPVAPQNIKYLLLAPKKKSLLASDLEKEQVRNRTRRLRDTRKAHREHKIAPASVSGTLHQFARATPELSFNDLSKGEKGGELGF